MSESQKHYFEWKNPDTRVHIELLHLHNVQKVINMTEITQ